jgi:hypothetical protein
VPWVLDLALGKELFAGQAVPSALCRELPLGTGSAEGNRPCAESISLSAKPVNPVVNNINVLSTLGSNGREKNPTSQSHYYNIIRIYCKCSHTKSIISVTIKVK